MNEKPNESFLSYVLEQFATRLDVVPRAMFGGFGLYSDGGFFGIVHGGRLYFKTDESTRAPYIAEGMECFRPSPEQSLKNYYEVPVSVLEDGEALSAWALQAVAVNSETSARKA